MSNNTNNLEYHGDPSLQRLCDDAMQDFPTAVAEREEWNRYNERLCRRETSYSYRALKGNLYHNA